MIDCSSYVLLRPAKKTAHVKPMYMRKSLDIHFDLNKYDIFTSIELNGSMRCGELYYNTV